MAAITIFVTLLLIWVVVRFNRRSNPTPARFTHNTPIEVTWTLVPVVILVFIGAFSLPVLFDQTPCLAVAYIFDADRLDIADVCRTYGIEYTGIALIVDVAVGQLVFHPALDDFLVGRDQGVADKNTFEDLVPCDDLIDLGRDVYE